MKPGIDDILTIEKKILEYTKYKNINPIDIILSIMYFQEFKGIKEFYNLNTFIDLAEKNNMSKDFIIDIVIHDLNCDKATQLKSNLYIKENKKYA
jgi:hypothetical protein